MGSLSREFEVLATALVLFVFYPPPSIFVVCHVNWKMCSSNVHDWPNVDGVFFIVHE